MSTILRIEGLVKAYRGVTALDGVSLNVAKGAITGLIGPNGSGKSTLFDCVSGFQRQDSGRVWLDAGRGEVELTRSTPVRIARAGLRRTFQQLKVFAGLSVRDNLLTAAQAAPGFSALTEVLRLGGVRDHERELRRRAERVLEDCRLVAQRDAPAGALSYGQKKLLELGMALMTDPKVLLLDEPVAGVNPTLIEELKAQLIRVCRRGVTLFIVEHNLKLVFDLCERIFVLDRGRLLREGSPDEVARDARVMEAYLGAQAHPARPTHG
ncbi:MAG TPA: ABC transporter ATP-binding protein [Gammaproteobacteria bacterium]|nr:ABC transporter ATP-binding protein [Gammaproteobacteria bacterium]